jgi:hypothetical protein
VKLKNVLVYRKNKPANSEDNGSLYKKKIILQSAFKGGPESKIASLDYIKSFRNSTIILRLKSIFIPEDTIKSGLNFRNLSSPIKEI